MMIDTATERSWCSLSLINSDFQCSRMANLEGWSPWHTSRQRWSITVTGIISTTVVLGLEPEVLVSITAHEISFVQLFLCFQLFSVGLYLQRYTVKKASPKYGATDKICDDFVTLWLYWPVTQMTRDPYDPTLWTVRKHTTQLYVFTGYSWLNEAANKNEWRHKPDPWPRWPIRIS